MKEENKHILPRYLRGKFQIIGTVTFTAFFALVFLLVSIPFSHNAWFELGPSQAFAFTAVFFAICLLILIISRRIMYATRRMRMTYLMYGLWILAEVFIICLLYCAFTIQGDEIGIIDIMDTPFDEMLWEAFLFSFTSLIVPNIIAGMYFAILDKNKTIQHSKSKEEAHAEARQQQKITLYDKSGNLKFSANLRSIYYFEADDNYIIVWYEDNAGQLAKFMVRSRLKNIEEEFGNLPLLRCNRKFIINAERVRILRQGEQGYELELDNSDIPVIPVTKTYEARILQRFSTPCA